MQKCILIDSRKKGMFIVEFQTRLCGRTVTSYMIRLMPNEIKDGEGKEEEWETFTNISHLFFFLQQRTAQQRFKKISLGGISFDSSLNFASIKISCKLQQEGREKEEGIKKGKRKAFGVCGMAEIRSKILLICHFSLLFLWFFVWNLFFCNIILRSRTHFRP